MLKVTILVGAADAYACIRSKTTSMDVRLDHGKSAEASLAGSALELREKAAHLLQQATLIEQAQSHLEAQRAAPC